MEILVAPPSKPFAPGAVEAALDGVRR
jgi:hypothetical protein